MYAVKIGSWGRSPKHPLGQGGLFASFLTGHWLVKKYIRMGPRPEHPGPSIKNPL